MLCSWADIPVNPSHRGGNDVPERVAHEAGPPWSQRDTSGCSYGTAPRCLNAARSVGRVNADLSHLQTRAPVGVGNDSTSPCDIERPGDAAFLRRVRSLRASARASARHRFPGSITTSGSISNSRHSRITCDGVGRTRRQVIADRPCVDVRENRHPVDGQASPPRPLFRRTSGSFRPSGRPAGSRSRRCRRPARVHPRDSRCCSRRT